MDNKRETLKPVVINTAEVVDEEPTTAEVPVEIPTQGMPDHDNLNPEENTETPFWTRRKVGAMAIVAPVLLTGVIWGGIKFFGKHEDGSSTPPPTGDRPATSGPVVPGPAETAAATTEQKDYTNARIFFAGDIQGFDETKRFVERRATTEEEALQDVVMLLQNGSNVNKGKDALQALGKTKEQLAEDTPALVDALVADSGIEPNSPAGKLLHDLIKKNIKEGTYATFELTGGKVAGNSLTDGTLIARRLDLGEKDLSKKNDVVEELEFDFSEKVTKEATLDSPWQYDIDLDKK